MTVYEWDPRKEEENIHKHGVDFTEATTVFDDPLLLISEDDSSWVERRFFAIGVSSQDRQLLVVYCERGGKKGQEEVIRIISARPLTPSERRRVEKI